MIELNFFNHKNFKLLSHTDETTLEKWKVFFVLGIFIFILFFFTILENFKSIFRNEKE